MKIVICSDGMPAAESAMRLGAAFAVPLKADVVVLGVAEKLVIQGKEAARVDDVCEGVHLGVGQFESSVLHNGPDV